MKKYIPVLKRTKLFAGVGDEEITSMLSCLGASLRKYKTSLQRAVCTFREMTTGGTAAYSVISESEKYSERHMWHRKAARS